MNFLKRKPNTNNNTEITKEERIKNGIMFFIMILFFGFLVMSIRTNDTTLKDNKEKNNNVIDDNTSETTNSVIDGVDFLRKNNFSYIYTFETENKKEKITGKIYNSKEKFTLISENETLECARLGEDYFVLKDNNYQFSEIPTTNLLYSNIESLTSLLEMSLFEEKKERWEFEIDPIDMFDIYNPDFSYDSFSDYGTDNAYIYYNGNTISKIKLNLDNYQKTITNDSNAKLQITLEYFDYSKQEDFDIK